MLVHGRDGIFSMSAAMNEMIGSMIILCGEVGGYETVIYKELGNMAVCIEECAWKGVDASNGYPWIDTLNGCVLADEIGVTVPPGYVLPVNIRLFHRG